MVLLSSQGVASRPEAGSHARLRAFEAALRGSDLDWTILRPGGFDSNAVAWAPSVRADRLVAAPSRRASKRRRWARRCDSSS